VTTLAAAYFDGKTSRRHDVGIEVVAGRLQLTGADWQRVVAAVAVSEPSGRAPRTLAFGDGSYCEVDQGAELDALLAALGHRHGAVVRWQASWRMAVAALLVIAALIGAGYRWGLPWAAAAIAPRIPPALVTQLSDHVLQVVDAGALAPSALPTARRQALEENFRRLTQGDADLAACSLLFRKAGAIGPNAFALPDGRIVLFDELVALAADDAEVRAVLAHELGHVKYRHGIRQLIQSSVVAAIVAGYLGDISSLFSGLGTLLLESAYSRSFELEADAYGARLLRHDGDSPALLAAMLEKLEKAHTAKHKEAADGADWLSSHPETAARIKRLNELR